MKILFYNWAQFDDPGLAGGGVSLYLRNIIRELAAREGVEVYFLSSGRSYGLFRRKPFIKETGNRFRRFGVRTFTLVNSPIKAPAHDAFYSIDRWLRDTRSIDILKTFLSEHGPFDAMHVHNLEGISANILSIDKDESVKRIFYTFHNYMPLCPQIELLYGGEQLCTDYVEGSRCVGCLGHTNQMDDLISYQRVGGWLKGRGLSGHPLGNFLFGVLSGTKQITRATKFLVSDVLHGFRTGFANWTQRPREDAPLDHGWDSKKNASAPSGFPIRAGDHRGDHYRMWREANAGALRSNVTRVFAVSDLARDTALKFLPEGSVVEALPLPMDITISDERRRQLRKDRKDSTDVNLSFVGYNIPSKGLPFMIDALSAIDDPYYKEHVNIFVVARLGEQRHRQLVQLDRRFKSVTVIPSYARSQIVPLSQKFDLNVVPSIWWETFNQVTVELGLLGVPSLVSSNVGAKQTIADQDTFVFRTGDKEDFLSKLDPLVKDASMRQRFFATPLAMPTMTEHVDALLRHYSGHGS